MSSKALNVIVLLLAVQSICAAANVMAGYYDTYYDPKNNSPAIYVPENSKTDMEAKSFRGISCSCENLVCKCCTGIKLRSVNFDNEVCAVINYDAEDEAVEAALTLNDEDVQPILTPTTYKFKIHGHVCGKVHHVKVCASIKKFSVVDDKLDVSADMETYIPQQPALVLHFNDMQI